MPEKSSRKIRKTARSQKTPLPLIFLGIGGLLLVALAVIFLTQQPATATPTPPAPAPASDTRFAPRVGLEEALQAFENGDAVLLDVRSAESFGLKRITGAVNIPENELPTRLAELDKNDWIIPYCT